MENFSASLSDVPNCPFRVVGMAKNRETAELTLPRT